MSILKNAAGVIVPVRESRRKVATLGALNAEVVLELDGDESAIIHVLSGGLVGTVEFSAAYDNTSSNFHAIPVYPVANAAVGGTAPVSSRPLVQEALTTAQGIRSYCVSVGQFRALRVRLGAYTSGNASVTLTSDPVGTNHLGIQAKTMTELVSVTAAVGVAVTATLPAVVGLRHIIDFVEVTRSATAGLTPAAAPVVITSTNLPGSFALTCGQDAGGVGVDKDMLADFGGTGLAATATNTNTTIVCPAYVGVVWRINVGYRLGI